jgi:hypothetical protein
MTLPPEILEDLAAFKAKLPTVVRKKRVRRPEAPSVTHEPKPIAPDPNVRRNGAKSWLVMVSTAHAYAGLKSREDPVVKDSPITQAPYGVSHMTGNTARVCTDAALFKKGKK